MKWIVLLSLVALVSSGNVKRQILLTQPILPIQAIPTMQAQPMLPLNQMQPPIMTQPGSFLEQQRDSLAIEAPDTIKSENLPIMQENFKSNLNLQTLTNEQLKMLMLSPNFQLQNLAHFGLNSFRGNLPLMLPLPPNIQLQNPGLQQVIPNLFNPSIMNPINNVQPHSFSSFLLPSGQQFSSQILPMSQFSSPLMQGQQLTAPFLLPKPAQRFFNILPTTLAPEVSLSGNVLPQKNILSSGVKGRIISNLPITNSNKNLFTPKDVPIMQESM